MHRRSWRDQRAPECLKLETVLDQLPYKLPQAVLELLAVLKKPVEVVGCFEKTLPLKLVCRSCIYIRFSLIDVRRMKECGKIRFGSSKHFSSTTVI